MPRPAPAITVRIVVAVARPTANGTAPKIARPRDDDRRKTTPAHPRSRALLHPRQRGAGKPAGPRRPFRNPPGWRMPARARFAPSPSPSFSNTTTPPPKRADASRLPCNCQSSAMHRHGNLPQHTARTCENLPRGEQTRAASGWGEGKGVSSIWTATRAQMGWYSNGSAVLVAGQSLSRPSCNPWTKTRSLLRLA